MLARAWVAIDLFLNPAHGGCELLFSKIQIHEPLDCRQIVRRDSNRFLECASGFS